MSFHGLRRKIKMHFTRKVGESVGCRCRNLRKSLSFPQTRKSLSRTHKLKHPQLLLELWEVFNGVIIKELWSHDVKGRAKADCIQEATCRWARGFSTFSAHFLTCLEVAGKKRLTQDHAGDFTVVPHRWVLYEAWNKCKDFKSCADYSKYRAVSSIKETAKARLLKYSNIFIMSI